MKQKDEQQLWDLLLKDDAPDLANQKPIAKSGNGKIVFKDSKNCDGKCDECSNFNC